MIDHWNIDNYREGSKLRDAYRAGHYDGRQSEREGDRTYREMLLKRSSALYMLKHKLGFEDMDTEDFADAILDMDKLDDAKAVRKALNKAKEGN